MKAVFSSLPVNLNLCCASGGIKLTQVFPSSSTKLKGHFVVRDFINNTQLTYKGYFTNNIEESIENAELVENSIENVLDFNLNSVSSQYVKTRQFGYNEKVLPYMWSIDNVLKYAEPAVIEEASTTEGESTPGTDIASLAEAFLKDKGVKKSEETTQPQANQTIKRNFVELENIITSFEQEVQELFNNSNPTVEEYNAVVGNYEFDLSAELPESLRKDIESKLRDVKNSFTIVQTSSTQPQAGVETSSTTVSKIDRTSSEAKKIFGRLSNKYFKILSENNILDSEDNLFQRQQKLMDWADSLDLSPQEVEEEITKCFK